MARCPSPASSTKHLERLDHSIPRDEDIILPLRQISSAGGSSTGTTGTTLWLGAQVLAAYLADCQLSTSDQGRRDRRRKLCLDLGSGIGFLPLCLASWGWDVIATDIEPVVSGVLRENVDRSMEIIHREQGRRAGKGIEVGIVQVLRLDWTDYLDPSTTPPHPDPSFLQVNEAEPVRGEYLDLLITSDTLYTSFLVRPLWSTLAHLSAQSRSRHPRGKAPDIYLALENRDPEMIGRALALGREVGFRGMKRVPDGKIAKALEKAGWGWKREDWEGVEVWKMRLEG